MVLLLLLLLSLSLLSFYSFVRPAYATWMSLPPSLAKNDRSENKQREKKNRREISKRSSSS